MRFTTVQINGLVAIGLLGLVAAGLMYLLIQNDLGCHATEIIACLAMDVGGIVWVAKSWGGYAPDEKARKEIAKDFKEE